jgi:hypothetical protein
MGILTRAGDLLYTLRFLRLLTTPWEETGAFKAGIIDEDGKKIKKPSSSADKEVYNTFHRLVFSIKRLVNKIPGGKSKFGSYVAALLLIKEKLELTDKGIERIVEACGLDRLDILAESSQWFILPEGNMSPGIYRMNEDGKMLNSTCEEVCKKGDRVRVENECYPIENICGLDIFEVTHIPTNQKIYITSGELYK